MTDTPTQLPLFAPGEDEAVAAQIEARRLRPLAQLWTPEALSRAFLLSNDDLVQIRTCRGSHNRLGFALQLRDHFKPGLRPVVRHRYLFLARSG